MQVDIPISIMKSMTDVAWDVYLQVVTPAIPVHVPIWTSIPTLCLIEYYAHYDKNNDECKIV